MISASTAIAFIVGMIVGPILVAAVLLCLIRRALKRSTDEPLPPPEIPTNGPVSLDWTISTVEGEEVNLAKYADGHVLFLNFWATWCPPCRAEMPSIEKLYQKLRERVSFACIASDDADVLGRFLESDEYSFPVFRLQQDPPADFDTDGIPVTFVLSPTGEILLKHDGAADWADEEFIAFLHECLDADSQNEPIECVNV